MIEQIILQFQPLNSHLIGSMIPLHKRHLMMLLALDSPSRVLALLQFERIVDQFYHHLHHRFYLNYYALDHLLCCIRIPFVTLPVFYQQILTTVHYLRLIYRLLQHQVGTAFDILRL